MSAATYLLLIQTDLNCTGEASRTDRRMQLNGPTLLVERDLRGSLVSLETQRSVLDDVDRLRQLLL